MSTDTLRLLSYGYYESCTSYRRHIAGQFRIHVIRFFDILFASATILLLSPVLIPVALVLRLTGEGEIFFRQTRVGQQRKHFRLWKFATMLKDSPNLGSGVITLKDDPRVLPAGKFLRKTKINELPQLINVLVGDMSLIGPRPQAIRVFDLFPADMQDIMTTVPPGLSGVGSILFRDEDRIMGESDDMEAFYANVISPYKAEVECWFADNRSVPLYFKLIFLTVWVIISPASNIVWKMLPNLPRPPEALRRAMQISFPDRTSAQA